MTTRHSGILHRECVSRVTKVEFREDFRRLCCVARELGGFFTLSCEHLSTREHAILKKGCKIDGRGLPPGAGGVPGPVLRRAASTASSNTPLGLDPPSSPLTSHPDLHVHSPHSQGDPSGFANKQLGRSPHVKAHAAAVPPVAPLQDTPIVDPESLEARPGGARHPGIDAARTPTPPLAATPGRQLLEPWSCVALTFTTGSPT